MINAVILSVLLAVDEAPPAAAAPPESKPKLVVVPFAALSADVSPRAGLKAAGMLSTEFKSAEKFELVDVKRSSTDPFADALAEARKNVDQAKELRGKRKFRLAEEALQKALTTYRTAAAGLPEIGEVVDAYALLSAVQYNTGRDDEGAKSLSTALTLAPNRDLPLALTSPLFAKVVADTRKQVKDSSKGTLLFESAPSNAAVAIDGVSLGATPVLISDVPPGLHVWKAALPSGETVGGTVEVLAGKQAVLKALPTAKDPEARLMVAIAQNKLDADAVAAAKEYAKANEAELLVLGGMSRDGKGVALDSFMFVAATGELRRLPRSTFDTELLSAGMEFFNLAGEMAKKGRETGDAVKVPASVSFGVLGSTVKTADAKYGQEPGRDAAADALEADNAPPPAKDGPEKAPARRIPLKKK